MAPSPLSSGPFWVALPRNCWHIFLCIAFISMPVSLFLSPPFSSSMSNRIENLIISSFCCRSSFFVCFCFPNSFAVFYASYWLSGKMSCDRSSCCAIFVGASFRSFGAQVAQQAFVFGFGQSSKKNTKTASLKTTK